MTENKHALQIHPGRCLGWISLGASVHEIMTRLKSSPQLYPHINLSYSSDDPIHGIIVVDLPDNGLRLRFDGVTQRLRLIEILDFSKNTFYYKKDEIVKLPTGQQDAISVTGPSFKHIYNRLFGPAYAGEYIAPSDSQEFGTYILSYPGLAIRFGLKHKSWSEKADFVTVLTTAATPAQSIAIFSGSSWPEVRNTLYTKDLSVIKGNKKISSLCDDIEMAVLHGEGGIEMIRRSSPSYTIKLDVTTPQDLVAEFGPPAAIYHRAAGRPSIHTTSQPNQGTYTRDQHNRATDQSFRRRLQDSDDLDWKNEKNLENELDGNPEMFYNFFHRGFDALISNPTPSKLSASLDVRHNNDKRKDGSSDGRDKLVVTKLFLHSNIPGSYTFNRHRRLRWVIRSSGSPTSPDDGDLPNSEMTFSAITSQLRLINRDNDDATLRGMILNRGWDESPESSIELLGEMEDSSTFTPISPGEGVSNTYATITKKGANTNVEPEISSNSQLFGFPGMLFEVVDGDLISCVTIY